MEKKQINELSDHEQQLIHEARAIRRRAYAPYSNYKVGAALFDDQGRIHTGCDVEGADFTLTTHAEVCAINSMVKAGALKMGDIAVVVQSDIGHGMPCGLCRQKIREFAVNRRIRIIGVNLDSQEEIREIFVSTLDELLPYSFGPDFL
jgi:cytidine deaminase